MDKKLNKIVESIIFDFFCNNTVNEVINTKDEAIEIEKHLRNIIISNISKIIK